MVYHEKTAWAGLIVSVITAVAYIVLVLSNGGAAAPWFPIMLWTIGGGVVLTVLITIIWGMIGSRDDRASGMASDIRDTDIAHMGARVEYAFVVIAGLGVIVLCAVGAELFWIANTMFAGFAVSAFIGGIARVIAYRRGLN